MLRATKPQKKGRRSKISGICAAARELGVERTHLYRVLTGSRVSESLTRRYNAFVAANAKRNHRKHKGAK